MRVLLFFNELSCLTSQRKEHVDEALRGFVHMLKEITRWRRDAALISEVSLKDLEVAPGYYYAEWAAQPANVDLGRQIRRLQNRAPSSDEIPPGLVDEVDYSWYGQRAMAMRAAHLLDGIMVSLLVDPLWDSSWIRADRSLLTTAPGGEPIVIEEVVQVRHAAALHHAEYHRVWFEHAGLPDLKHGSELWESRDAIFPHLRFLPRTRRQLLGLRTDWVVPAAYELRRIDHAISDWDPKRTHEPTWRSKVTPESESRKRLCRFEDFDGTMRTFDLHGRFTPGPGRVYFRLVPELRTAIIAHVGTKLGV